MHFKVHLRVVSYEEGEILGNIYINNSRFKLDYLIVNCTFFYLQNNVFNSTIKLKAKGNNNQIQFTNNG